MPSELQSETARLNGAKSRGPKTLAGKLNSRRNALTHGQSARLLTLDRESDDRFTLILAALQHELQPETELEHQLVETIAHARWRTVRTWAHEKAILDTATADARRSSTNPDLPTVEHAGAAFRNLSDHSRVLLMLDRNENRYHRLYRQSLHQLFTLRDRNKDAQTNPLTASKQSVSEKTDPRSSEVLEARIEAHRQRELRP